MKFINLIGIELEGGWIKPPAGLQDDGSIDLADYWTPSCGCGDFRCQCHDKHECDIDHLNEKPRLVEGEMVSPPLKLLDVADWITTYYPNYFNKSCGFHIHISFFRNSDYSRLMNWNFYKHFRYWMRKWGEDMKFPPEHEFWCRFEGDNRHCRDTFRPEEQVFLTRKRPVRYSHLNFCWGLHKTLECRLFPMFNKPAEAIEATLSFVACVEDILTKTKDRSQKEFDLVITV